MSFKKLPAYWLPKAQANLKKANELIDSQRIALNLFKNIRKGAKSSDQIQKLRNLIGLKSEITGSKGIKNLGKLMKERISAAKAVRKAEGHFGVKVKFKYESLKHINRILKTDKSTLQAWKNTGAKQAVITELDDKIKMYELAKEKLVNRAINARGKGVRFVRINGRIVPIRPKK